MRTKTLPFLSIRHQVRDEDLLLAVLGLHHVRARGTDELRDDDALGAVDDERAELRHPREVAHEDGLLADLTGLAVLERDLDRQRPGVGQVLLATLLDGSDGLVEGDVFEDDGEIAGVVLDGRDVVDRLAKSSLCCVSQPVERPALDVNEVRKLERPFKAREAPTLARGIERCQDCDSFRVRRGLRAVLREGHKARPAKIAQEDTPP
jgi:hypothetical protein